MKPQVWMKSLKGKRRSLDGYELTIEISSPLGPKRGQRS